MPIDSSKLTAAPMQLHLGEKVFLLSPMTDKMHGEMNNYARQRHIRTSIEAVQEMPVHIVREVIKTVTEESHGLEWNQAPLAEMFKRGPEPLAYLLWISIRPNDKKITLPKVEQALLDGDVRANTIEAFRVYRELNSIDVKNSEAPEESEPQTGQ